MHNKQKKIPDAIRGYTLYESEPVHKAYYYLQRFNNHKIIIVVDDNDRTVGIITPGDFKKLEISTAYGDTFRGYDWLDNKTVGEFCNKYFKYIKASEDKYSVGRGIFADAGIKILDIPILDESGIPVGIFARWQAFYKEFYDTGRLLRMWYAEPIMNAAKDAKSQGYDEISVIEFGVAGGTGLILAELYARETERLTGIKIQLYGFDLGTGLPELEDRDMRSVFKKGDFVMDYDKLKKQLISAELVLGDVRDTTKTFLEEYNPAPIGVMLIDVDLYSSTVPILDMLLESDDYFLPIIHMYFDDLFPTSEFEGEWLAVKEFNRKSDHIKIAPEGYWIYNTNPAYGTLLLQRYRSKFCYRYNHPKMNVNQDWVGALELNL